MSQLSTFIKIIPSPRIGSPKYAVGARGEGKKTIGTSPNVIISNLGVKHPIQRFH